MASPSARTSRKPRPPRRSGALAGPPPPNLLAEWLAAAGLGDDVQHALIVWLAKQLVSDQFAKLEQGGHQEGGIPLRKVFVDLPITEQFAHDIHPSEKRLLFLETLLKLKPTSLCGSIETVESVPSSEDSDDASIRARRGFLVIGGPGQGKSTLGQLACQVHRAALLAPFTDRLQPAQRGVARSFADPATRTKSGWPETPLFPVRIVLPEAAAWLAQHDSTPDARPGQLLRFLAARAGSRGVQISPEALEKLLAHAPCLLVLDGLDEVGALEDRARLMTAARELFASLGEAGAQGLVVATTRPQGYAGELERIGIPLSTVYLAPLLRKEALAYGRKLADAKLGAQPDDHARVMQGLESAANEPATAHLLTTPLQVTILVALVQRMGRVPSQRWGLFARYFETIYDREVERNTYAAPLLREQRMHIERIHARVGLLLQVESEQAGGTDARMPRGRLEAVADAVLREDDVDDETRALLVRRIVRAAEERLVFLVEPEPSKFGFEIRSLQEFMAAWALTADGDALTEARLVQIAKAPTFRAVTLFLASKFFTDGSPLRDALADRVCGALDDDATDSSLRAIHAGALLALEILEEGSALNQPKYTKQLMERACGLLDLPPCREQARLERVPTAGAAEVLRAAVESRLTDPSADRALGSWVTLMEAADADAAWAKKLGKAAWHALPNPTQMLAACQQLGTLQTNWLADRIEERPEKVQPGTVMLWRPVSRQSLTDNSWFRAFTRLGRQGLRMLGAELMGDWGAIDAKGRDWTALATFSNPPSQWQPWVHAAQFGERSTAATLGETLRNLAKLPAWNQRKQLAAVVPWPLAACLRSADTPQDLLSYAALAESGDLGDHVDWKAAQDRWSGTFDLQAFFALARRAPPWERSVFPEMPPLGAVGSLHGPWVIGDEFFSQALAAISGIDSESLRSHLAFTLMVLLQRVADRGFADVPWAEFERWVEAAGALAFVVIVDGLKSSYADSWLDGLDQLGLQRRVTLLWSNLTPAITEWLCIFYCNNPERHGLIYWLRLHLMNGVRARSIRQETRDAVLNVMAKHPVTEPGLQADAVLIRLWLGDINRDEVTTLLDTVHAQVAREPNLWVQVSSLVEQSALEPAIAEMLLVNLLHRPGLPPQAASVAVEALRAFLQTRRSRLAYPATWTHLRLPLPRPSAHFQTHQGFALPDTPVVLSRVQVQHVRGLADLTLELAPPQATDQGQWAILLGPNGIGKTTLLRAIVVALRNLSDPKIWPKGTFATPWRANDAPQGKSTISVQLADGKMFYATIQKNGSEVFSQEPKDQPAPFPIFAYGCRRGSALGGASREVNITEDDGPEIATLFDEGAPLVHAETWLKEWDGAAAREPEKYGATYGAVRQALQDLLAVDEVVVRDRQVFVSGPSVGTSVPFAALSDGYLTTAGWFLDLVARWIELALKHLGNVSAGILDRMTGLVLLDEIDLNLHPRWQIDAIPRIKKLLPKMSFIVTTHNPLTLVGARPEEIWILSTDSGRVRAERGTEAPMLLTGGQIYSRYFGVQDIYPHDLGEALRRYGFLSGDPLRTDEEQTEMEGLRAKLKEQGVDPGWEEVQRETTQPARRPKRASRAKGNRA